MNEEFDVVAAGADKENTIEHVESCFSDSDNIRSLLRKWELPESVIIRFQENEIKPNQLRYLNEDILKELCPLIGHRILIKSKLDEFYTRHINLDFEKKYLDKSLNFFTKWHHLDKSLNFFTKWHPFVNRVINLKFNSTRDDHLSYLYENICQNPDDDQKVTDQIKLLCYLIPPRGRLNKKTKFTTLDCIENFIVENFGDISKKIQDLASAGQKQKQTLQTFLIRCGSAGDNICKYYLAIDKEPKLLKIF